MIPFGCETVTLMHRADTGWIAVSIGGCSVQQVRSRMLNNNTAMYAAETICRIPAGGAVPAPGDAILPGRHDAAAANEIELVRLLEAHRAGGAFRVESVSDNTRAGRPFPHYAARGR